MTGQLRALVDASPIAILALDRLGLVREWNPAAERLFGWTAEQTLGQALPDAALAGVLEAARSADQPPPAPASPACHLRFRRRDGRMLDIEASVAPIRDVDGAVCGAMGLVVDVTDRERLQRRLQYQAQHDSLTGLPNRQLIVQRLAEALEAGHRSGAKTGLLLLNLDKFKEVNDALGHVCGDQLLAQIGPRLVTSAVRGHDTVARLAGDEFAVLLPEPPGLAGAVVIADRILAALQTPFTVGVTATDHATVDIAASIGVTLAPDHGTEPVDLLRQADAAMHEAKESGDGVAVYQPGRGDGAPSRFELLGDLRRALTRRELVVHYQPKVDVATGALTGVEALVRWQHPRRGLLAPAEFVPLAETTDLIHPLTDRVLDLALAQARSWSDAGLTVPVAVNLSARCLHDTSLPARVTATLDRHGVPASRLFLEITESAIMRDPAGALAILCELAGSGIRLSLDDFGTGYSSMTYLRRLPVAELKVDRSFVLDLVGQRADTVLVRSTVDLGHNLGLSVVAEGVEDAATLDALGALGCDIAQGYYFARPMPADELDAWLATRGPDPATGHRHRRAPDA
ncbi:MAG: putative bifunctional diguanylate cyclase/phosphodiesterase [Acidimicrobiales bacterium]